MADQMNPAKHVATGTVTTLALNGKPFGAEGEPLEFIDMKLNGPKGDSHASAIYDATTPNYQGESLSMRRHGEEDDERWDGITNPIISNSRKWTAVSKKEMDWLCSHLGIDDWPAGGVLDTFMIDGISSFTAIPPGFELAFFRDGVQQCRLLVREPNTPCSNAARALFKAWKGDVNAQADPDFISTFKDEAALNRGLMGDVIKPGLIHLGDEVRVFSPKRHPAEDIWWTKAA